VSKGATFFMQFHLQALRPLQDADWEQLANWDIESWTQRLRTWTAHFLLVVENLHINFTPFDSCYSLLLTAQTKLCNISQCRERSWGISVAKWHTLSPKLASAYYRSSQHHNIEDQHKHPHCHYNLKPQIHMEFSCVKMCSQKYLELWDNSGTSTVYMGHPQFQNY
jgi:hypothetical protein